MIPPIAGVPAMSGLPPVAPSSPRSGPGFGNALTDSLQQVSELEHHADALIQDVAVGGGTQIHEVMVATTQSALAVDLLVQVRNRALEAYTEIMRMQL